jgi:hypothetical protein
MELSISPYKLVLVAGIVAGSLYLRSTWTGAPLVPGGGKAPPVPEPLRELQRDMQQGLEKLPGASPSGEAWPVEHTTTRVERPPETATEPAPEKKPPRVFTPDEKARSAIALADGYAENGLFDKAYAKLEEAATLEVSDAVKQELAAAQERVTTLMRARRR